MRFNIVCGLALAAMLWVLAASAADVSPQVAACQAQCSADANTEKYCRERCKGARSAEERDAIDWACASSCRKNGTKLEDCIPRCPRPRPE